MLKLALRNLGTRKLRLGLTAFAVLIGVAMISATYVFTDSINRAFDNIFAEATAGLDVVVSGRNVIEPGGGGGGPQSVPPPVPQSLVGRTERVPGVKKVGGLVSDFAQVLDRKGKPIETGGAPTLAFSAVPSPFNPLVVREGHQPTIFGEVALDKGAADEAGVGVGDTVGIVTDRGARDFKVAGIVRYGSGSSSLGGASITVFTLPEAQWLFGKRGKVDTIDVAGEPGVTEAQLAARVKRALPRDVEVRTGQQEADYESDQVAQFLSFLTTALLVFGGVAVFVGAFIIFNTFSITVAQRTREFALLRTIGATRRQVLGQVVAEALFVGLVASVAGVFAGVGLAYGITALFKAFGADLPQAGLALHGRTVAVGLAVGIAVSLIASLVPARRATRVPPVAALHVEAVTALRRRRLLRWAFAAILLGGGLAALLAGILGDLGSTTRTLSVLGGGAVAVLLGVAVISPVVVRPIAAIVGWPGERLTHVTGRLARENAARNPGRTAITAAALMIGLALITFVASFTAGLQGLVNRTLDRVFAGQFFIQNTDGFSPIPGRVAGIAARVPGVAVATGVRQQPMKIDGRTVNGDGVDQRVLPRAYALDWAEGSNAVLERLAPGEAVVNERVAKDEGLKVGGVVTATVISGRKVRLKIDGIYTDNSFFAGGVILTRRQFDALYPGTKVQGVMVTINEGADPAKVHAAINGALKAFPTVETLSRQQFKDKIRGRIGQVLNLLYALLAISVIVSLFGIVNTLVLSIYERTREIGLTRALGMTSGQVRSTIRQESVITALVGTLLGIAVGVAFAWLITLGLEEDEVIFTVPVGSIVAFFFVGLVAGVISAVFPARRAAKVSVLEALAYE